MKTPEIKNPEVPYTGNLIDFLMQTAENAANKVTIPESGDDDIELERRERRGAAPLTIAEVIDRSAMFGTGNPYEALVRSVGRWL